MPGKRSKKSKRAQVLRLYWVTTDDHDEDWFIVAHSAAEACRIHEEEEGYDRGDASSELVLTLPPEKQGEGVGWPRPGLLEELGAEVGRTLPDEHETLRYMAGSGARVVRFGDRVFGEGDIVSNVAIRLGMTEKH
jgi:hypothetical protein